MNYYDVTGLVLLADHTWARETHRCSSFLRFVSGRTKIGTKYFWGPFIDAARQQHPMPTPVAYAFVEGIDRVKA